jgi:hypothetical protein
MIELLRIEGGRMTRRRHLPGVLIILMLVMFSPIASGLDGQIDFVDGEVWIESSDGRQTADFGSIVELGDLLVTGTDGVVIVSLGDGARIKLRENSRVEIGINETTPSVGLEQGGLFAQVRRIGGRQTRFEVTTPTTVAGVRGTEFFAAYGRTIEDRPDLWLCVNEGAVEVAVRQTGSTTIVEEGEGVNVLNGTRTTDPRFFPWTQDLNWNFDPEQGEVRDNTDLNGAYSDLLDQDYD